MFPWDFARSAEAMFSRWAIKRVCKFLLKKKLGELILGDIDLDQLEVQFTRGTIQLSDLALNVDYINQKLAGSAVVLREGSIASLSIKIPWGLQNCEIELEELELVLAPFTGSKNHVSNSCSMPSSADKQHMSFGPDKIEQGTGRDTCGSVSLDIHEGVKTIAKIVKWLLTSFNVRLKNLIIAFDPCLEVNANKLPVNKSIVLRIAETEFGTFLYEDVDKVDIPKSDCLLGASKLTNFVKFEGAMIEVLMMTDIDKNSCPQDSLETLCNECSLSNLPLGSTIPILTSKSAGISGRMNLTIPLKNGSLDIHKIDAAVSFDPIELRLQPNTIEWIIFVSESIKRAGTAARSIHSNMIDSSCSGSRLHNHSSLRNSGILAADKTRPSIRKFSEDLHSDINCETFSEDLLPRMHVIQDWVPLSFKEDQSDLDQDIDQFFECFDEWRSSNATSGANGLWSWTCSVFGAISVASNVACGSGHVLTEHVETCLRATVAGFSLLLYFHDEEENISDQLLGSDQDVNESCQLDHLSPLTDSTQNPVLNWQSFDSYMSCFSSVNIDHSTVGEPNLNSLKIHHLDLKCQDVVFNFQIGSLKKDIQISIKHAKIDEYYNHKNNFRMNGFSHNGISCDQILTNKTMRQNVLAAFAPFPFHVQEDQGYDQETSVELKVEKFNENFSSQGRLIKVELMESFGDCSFYCTVSLADSNENSVSSTSFSVHLPHCVLWVNFHLADSLMNLFKKVEIYLKKSRENLDLLFDDFSCGKKLVSSNDVESASSSIKPVPTGDYLQGNVIFARTRIVICFPLQITEDFGHIYPMEKFIVLEHYPSPIVEKVSQVPYHLSKQLCAPNGSFCTPTVSLHFEVGTFDMYLTDSASEDAAVDQSTPLHLKDVIAVKVLSVTNRTDDQFGISIVWQKCPVTSPSMASRVWSMMSTHDHRSRNKVTGKACKYSSVAAVEDFEELSSEIRQDLILSSGFILQLSFSSILLNLRWHDYRQLNYLLDIVMPVLSNGSSSNLSVFEEDQPLCNHDISQATIIVDCDILDLQISADEVSDHTHSVGSWSCFRLVVQKFEIMSITNIGGISATNFFRLIHGEGQLWGSIFNGTASTSVTTQDVLLVSCMNSASRRGCGDGANVLSVGSAGTTITYLCNPELSRSCTSIFIRCGSIVAPDGRADWISDLCSFFNPPSENESSGSDVIQGKLSSNSTTYEASFFFELVDVALSYEPHFKHPVSNGDIAYVGCDGTFEANEGLSEQLVGCLLAASSFILSSHDISNSTISDYNIQLQDLGLLICTSSSLKSDNVSYDVSYLQKTGYAKVASGILLVAVLKIHGSRWEIECSDSHISFDTWHDTTHALFRLIAQLQQMYAPDMEDALAHLQSRWNTVQQNYNTNGSNDASDNSRASISFDAGKNLPKSDGNSQSIGLLDDIIENAFYTTRGSDNPVIPSLICRNNYNDGLNMSSNISLVEDVSSVKMSSNRSACNLGVKNSCSTSISGLDNSEIVSMNEKLLPQLIESNYFSAIIAPSLAAKGTPPVNDQRCKHDLPVPADVECRMGTWYEDGYLMVVDNHIPNSNILDSDQHDEESEFVPVDSVAPPNCSEKGKILLRNIDVRWRMFVGSGWSKQIINSTGKDGLELMLSGMNIHYLVYPDGGINVSKLFIHVQDFNLYDTRTNAPWKMVIGHYNSKGHPRESDSKAFKLDLETVRPDPATPLEDYRLFLECLPIRLHLDQSQISFLVSFFGDQSTVEDSLPMSKDVDRSFISEKKNNACRSPAIVEEALLPFFQKCDVKPLVVRVDYIPRHMDLASLRNGNYIELLNLVPWKGIDLQLKHVCALGLYGWMSVCETVVGQWLEDISHNQVHKLLKGLPPIRSLVSVATGTSKLITLPVKSYKRDKKLLKGMQRGAVAFVKSISLEAVGLGVHLASGAHDILLQTEYILANIQPSIPSSSEKSRIRKCANSLQPEGAQEGLRQAYESLSDGLSRTASGLLGTPIKEYRRGAGAGSALATAFRAAPAAVIAPVTASANAMRCALLGMRNSLDPEHMKESMDKYLGPSRP
ncbi:hypothetical protein KSP40_PGU008309 [Platanthera guangdongensis]|uniref:Autophagy-related protein 2 n=1 Tax=Platanthera guangdongensis TaxID=2320717 RepID=A0ABR2M909_9ASPA